jgi:hypothetical protein
MWAREDHSCGPFTGLGRGHQLSRWQTFGEAGQAGRYLFRWQEWRKLLHHFNDPFPTIEHYELIQTYPATLD